MKARIGTWHEEARTIDRCPSYYAADHEKLETTAGLTLDPAFAWLAVANGFDAPGAPATWEALNRIGGAS